MTNYEELSKSELIKLLKQRDEEILNLKGGYIYMIQFDDDKDNNVYKLGKTSLDTTENRFAQYRHNEAKTRGRLNHLRCGKVNDALKAEQLLHELIRMRVESTDVGNEWYQIDDENFLHECFDRVLDKYGLDDDDIVVKYDMNERAILEERLEPIIKYTMKCKQVRKLKNDTYFIDIDNKVIYQRTVNDTLSKITTRKEDYSLKDINDKVVAVNIERLISQMRPIS